MMVCGGLMMPAIILQDSLPTFAMLLFIGGAAVFFVAMVIFAVQADRHKKELKRLRHLRTCHQRPTALTVNSGLFDSNRNGSAPPRPHYASAQLPTSAYHRQAVGNNYYQSDAQQAEQGIKVCTVPPPMGYDVELAVDRLDNVPTDAYSGYSSESVIEM
jgi:hypothetical protein